ncbi:uncharacterized protein K02A2.6-like [Nematostella vectensis]|uniref:uncharacterized protein K02A2.6-like n=1 Tax=Nematostella vectensis TaxID=45351 RepID=UPI00207733FC|nr:uncharacterized protein K02A2.6-like [Nematostella vectensis]
MKGVQRNIGALEPFDGGDFADYSERLNSFFVANNIGQLAAGATEAEQLAADKKKVAVAISLIGKTTYSTLKDPCLPDLPADKTFHELTTILSGFYKPKVLEVAETCGSDKHLADACKHKDTICGYCSKPGHLVRVCFKKKRDEKSRQIHQITTEEHSREPDVVSDSELAADSIYTVYMHHVGGSGEGNPPKLAVVIEGKEVTMEVDTGSAVTLINVQDFESIGGSIQTLKPPTILLKGYTGNTIKCFGESDMCIQVGDQVGDLKIRIVEGPSLLGRDLMSKFTLPWQNIFSVVQTTTEDIIHQYPALFDTTTVGKLQGVQVSLQVDDSNPVFVKPRTVPFAVRDKYEQSLEKLEAEDIIERVEHSDWASPTVPVVKPSGDLRICGDYSVTINKHSTLEQYPVPSLEELLGKLAGGKKYTKLDLSQAYHQLELSPESRKFTTVNTTKGLNQYKLLTCGINSAVSIFQRTIENVLKGLPSCCVYIDDILITGETDEIHLENLHRVLQRLQECGLKLQESKFHFMLDQIVYLGFRISAAGISPTPEKFVPAFAELASPLYKLLRKDKSWKWEKVEQEAFECLKSAMCSDTVLQHYDPAAELVLHCDASSVGVGATILQPGPDGTLQPVAYASRTLSSAERNYFQIERESLAIVFGLTKFRQYLLGRHFKLLTEHKPLITLLGEHKPVFQLASDRIKRWALLLAAYNYTIEFIPGKDNVFADFLSRKPVECEPSSEEQVTVNVMFIKEEQIVTASMVAMETKKDNVLRKVLDYTRNGWPDKPEKELLPYYYQRLDLSCEDGELLWDSRVVIPESLQGIVLNDLQAEHFGIVKMKQLARKYLWGQNWTNKLRRL